MDRRATRVKLDILCDVHELLNDYGVNYKTPENDRKAQQIADAIFEMIINKNKEER